MTQALKTAAFFSLLASTQLMAGELPALPIQKTFHGFHFTPGRPCDHGLMPVDMCRQMVPKAWAPQEIDAAESLLEPLFAPTGGLPHFMAQIIESGFNFILRYSTGSGSAWFSLKDKSLNFADSIISMNYPPDTYSGFDLKKQITLHELAHAFDKQILSRSPEFMRLTGWRFENGQYVLARVSPQQVNAAVNEFVRAIHNAKLTEAYRINREFGLLHGFPTAYSMTNPGECFAELASHIYFDSRADQYLSPELIRWFRTHVLN